MNTNNGTNNGTNDRNDHDQPDDALRWQLRGLRRDAPPANDLWPGIAARLAPREAARPRRRWATPVALAASLLLVAGTVATLQWPRAPRAPAETLVQREAYGLEREYRAALQAMAADAELPAQADLAELDRNAALIRAALAQDPNSRLLLDQLRRTYAHRLALTHRLAYT